jgi:hypothetical protein
VNIGGLKTAASQFAMTRAYRALVRSTDGH